MGRNSAHNPREKLKIHDVFEKSIGKNLKIIAVENNVTLNTLYYMKKHKDENALQVESNDKP